MLCLVIAGTPLLAQEQTTVINNGRSAGMTPSPVQKSGTPTNDRSHENSDQDWDVHRNLPKQKEETLVYPQDVLVLQDELFNTSSRQEVVEQLEAMKALLRQLQADQEAPKTKFSAAVLHPVALLMKPALASKMPTCYRMPQILSSTTPALNTSCHATWAVRSLNCAISKAH